MALYIRKTKDEILRQALSKLEEKTPIKATSPGSVSRAFTEAIAVELGDFFDALDFNLAQSVLSSASSRGLDLIGELYDVQRRTISDLATIDAKVGAFYFYVDSPLSYDLGIPRGTRVYTSVDGFVGRQIGFETVEEGTLRAGRRRLFMSLKPISGNNLYAAAPGTLTITDFPNPVNVVLKCTNPKTIAPQEGYESDDNYRIRIIKSIRVASSGTLEAIRFKALNVNGVREVKVRQAPYGLGCFEVLIVPEAGTLSSAVQNEVTRALNIVRPVGVRMFMRQPSTLPTDITANIIVKRQNDEDPSFLSGQAQVSVIRYLNSLLPGDAIVYNRLLQAIMSVSGNILDVEVTRYAPNGIEVIRRNFTPKQDEQVVPGRISISPA